MAATMTANFLFLDSTLPSAPRYVSLSVSVCPSVCPSTWVPWVGQSKLISCQTILTAPRTVVDNAKMLVRVGLAFRAWDHTTTAA